MTPRKTLVLGSGGLSIGQGGEFDYSGSQGIKALREENVEVVLINPNIATIQTSEYLANTVYFLPVTADVVERVIERERPDSILVTFGGQTALNCGVELFRRGVLAKYDVDVLGTPIDAIIETEDREAFAARLRSIDVPVPPSFAAESVDAALTAAREIGYPVIARAAFALGGLGSGFANNDEELVALVSTALSLSHQVLIEKALRGWKEVEYEMVRDSRDNCIAVCNMENLDPLGIHTGDSIVVAPSQTLTNDEYHMLREVAIRVVRNLGIVGECNIQYALDPRSEQYYVIEVNARLSRSSALASKATGYPLAYIAAKLALGQSLTEIRNPVTRVTTACFEPALDYVVVKMPRWDLKKFSRVSPALGSSMKSVGEVMAIGRGFEEALQKAVRMTDTGASGVIGNDVPHWAMEDLPDLLATPNDTRLLFVGDAILRGVSGEEIYERTGIDLWFLKKIGNIVDAWSELRSLQLHETGEDVLRRAKMLGFSDYQIAIATGVEGTRIEKENRVRDYRKSLGILPVVKQIDTLAAEWPSQTNYLYLTYFGNAHDVQFEIEKNMIVLGGGPYRIGSSVEFDWCSVSCVNTLRRKGHYTTVINCNPETVSTDYDISDRLYFEELSFERVMDIADLESPAGVVVSMGGQTPNNLVMSLHRAGVPILGTRPEMIHTAEDRNAFSALLDRLGIDQPSWTAVTTLEAAKAFGEAQGYPLLVRPSYVLSGAAMRVVEREDELEHCLSEAARVSREHPVVLSKFITHAKEIEMDAVARNGELVAYAISEHIEDAGVHSGDATLVFPAQKLYLETVRRIKDATRQLARELRIHGPFNIQYLAKDNHIKIIECNLRCSRTFPFVSKVLGVNFVEEATRVLLSEEVSPIDKSAFSLNYVGVKAPQFSFTRLTGADPVLGVEMASTGEVACLGETVEDAFLLALLATGFRLPRKNIFLSTGPIEAKAKFLESARTLSSMDFTLFASEGTAQFLAENQVACTALFWPLDERRPNVIDYLSQKKIDLVINIPKSSERVEVTNGYLIRRTAVDHGIPLVTNLNNAILLVSALRSEPAIRSWQEYMRMHDH